MYKWIKDCHLKLLSEFLKKHEWNPFSYTLVSPETKIFCLKLNFVNGFYSVEKIKLNLARLKRFIDITAIFGHFKTQIGFMRDVCGYLTSSML